MGKMGICLALVCVLALTGCAAREPELLPASILVEEGETPRPSDSGASQELVLQAVDVKQETLPLTDGEVLSAYQRAVTAYGWFDRENLPCGQETVTMEGCRYYRVEDPMFSDVEDLRIYLRSIFSQEIVERLLPAGEGDAPRYRDIGGALFVLPFHREEDLRKGTVNVAVEQAADTAYMVNVTVELLDEELKNVTGMECCAFPYELTEGRWVFTDFQLVK